MGSRKNDREKRLVSHALVELRRFKLLPFGVYSAVLLDMSLGGFKVELTGEQIFKPGDRFWVHVPLSPVGISSKKKLICLGECRWFNTSKYRLGGVFTSPTKQDQQLMHQLLDTLQNRGLTGH